MSYQMLGNDIRELNRTLHSIDGKLDVIVKVIEKEEKKSEGMSIKEMMRKYFGKISEKAEEEGEKKIREESITENINGSFPPF